MAAADLLVTNIGTLYTLRGRTDGPRRGAELMEVGAVEDAALACHRGEVVAAGPRAEVEAAVELQAGAPCVDAAGGAVLPGLVDPHTHALFDRPRSWEFGERLRGRGYMEIAAAGGGIRASVRGVRQLDAAELERRTRERLRSCLRYGTTTVEVKSGYGLDLEHELKSSRIIAGLRDQPGLPRVVATCLAAHELADEWRDRREEYLDLVCREILPAVAAEGLAERVDCFCEPGVFTVGESRRVLEAGLALGLRATLHADELEGSGGAELAAALGADSADHLGAIGEAGIEALAASSTVGVLLPATIFSLGLDNWAPARRMIDAGCALALATDFNPGSCYCESMPLAMAIACTRLRLHPHEALSMATVNAAWALGRGGQAGSLVPGRPADFVLLHCPTVDELCHHLGLGEVAQTWVGGRRGWPDP